MNQELKQRILERKAAPISSYLIKVHSRCNLMCDYCYEYNCGNISWRSKPKAMPWDVYVRAVDRIIEHSVEHNLNNCFFSFHGGEPLLRGKDFFRQAVPYAKEKFGEAGVEISFGMQSNGTLMTEEWVDLLVELGIGVGISMDGPKDVHDIFRVHSNGDPSYDETRAGLEHLLTEKGRKVWGGFLSVINVESDPISVFEHLASFNPPSIDFLEPHGAWNKMPYGKSSPEDTAYGDWLIKLFDYWFHSSAAKVPIRKFDEIIEHYYGGIGSLESFGLEPVNLITIASDGDYECVDCIKASYPAAEVLGLSLENNSIDEVLMHPKISMRQIGLEALPKKCEECPLVNICGGGYFAHRYSPEHDFKNPTVFCADYQKLIHHIIDTVEGRI